MTKSPEEMQAVMIGNMPEKTGKPLEGWLAIVADSGVEKHGEIIKLLKSEHGMTHGFANLVAIMARNKIAPPPEDPVAAQYAGAKAGLKPIYDALITEVTAFGSDVEVSPKKAYVSLRRSKQFALIKPATKTRMDIGITLKGYEPTERLETTASMSSMTSHLVRITSIDEIDDELKGWLRAAYEAA